MHAAYLEDPIHNLRGVLIRCVNALEDVGFEGIACTGLSGLLVAPALAMEMGKRLAVVRKKQDIVNHSDHRIETNFKPGDRWVFIDDLISSGCTRDRVIQKLDEAGFPDAVGEYRYNDGIFRPYKEGEYPFY